MPSELNNCKLLLRNSIGKYSWSFQHFRALSIANLTQASDLAQIKRNVLQIYDSKVIQTKLKSYLRRDSETSEPEALSFLIEAASHDAAQKSSRPSNEQQQLCLQSSPEQR